MSYRIYAKDISWNELGFGEGSLSLLNTAKPTRPKAQFPPKFIEIVGEQRSLVFQRKIGSMHTSRGGFYYTAALVPGSDKIDFGVCFS